MNPELSSNLLIFVHRAILQSLIKLVVFYSFQLGSTIEHNILTIVLVPKSEMVPVDPMYARASALAFSSQGIWVAFHSWNWLKSYVICVRYWFIQVSQATYIPSNWFMTCRESLFNSIYLAPSPRASSNPRTISSYSASLLVIDWHLINCRTVSLVGVMSNTPRSGPFTLHESSVYRVQVSKTVLEATIASFPPREVF